MCASHHSDNLLQVPLSILGQVEIGRLASVVCTYGYIAWVRPYDDEARDELEQLAADDPPLYSPWSED